MMALRSAGFTQIGPVAGAVALELDRRGCARALEELQKYGKKQGADGVIGVRLSMRRIGFGVQYSAAGIAVRSTGTKHPPSPSSSTSSRHR